MTIRFAGVLILILSILAACVGYETVEAPADIRLAALDEAEHYIGMEYEYGGHDFYAKGIDCSGLVVNCYLSAVEDTDYYMPFADAAVINLLNTYTVNISTPEQGDLIFMGEDEITHVAIFSHRIGDELYFIDASSVTGFVGERSYPIDDPQIKGFGRLLLTHKYAL